MDTPLKNKRGQTVVEFLLLTLAAAATAFFVLQNLEHSPLKPSKTFDRSWGAWQKMGNFLKLKSNLDKEDIPQIRRGSKLCIFRGENEISK